MAGDSQIEWTDATWNPVTGCSKVSPGCAHCYAETLTRRFSGVWDVPDLPWTPANASRNVILHPERLSQPLRWTRPRMVFVNSMSDLFHNEIPDEFIAQVFAVMASAPQHTFQVLTKRPERMRALIGSGGFAVAVGQMVASAAPRNGRRIVWPLENVWLGVSIENRKFVERADTLREIPAAVKFISAEPLLGPLAASLWLFGIDWLIVGGESGPSARPMHLDWARDLHAAAQDSGTAFFMKQLGGYRAGTTLDDLPADLQIREIPHNHLLKGEPVHV